MIKKIFPFLAWFDEMSKVALRQDIISGITVALVLIPQSMAYAQLAGLPVYYGLYASFLPPMIASLFGSSRQLATGPVAVVSLMTSASLEPLATAGSTGYIQYAILLAFMVGAFQFLLGILRLGIVVNFLSHPVVNGFTNAAAIIIASSQLSKMFGVSVDKAEHHYETIWRVCVAAYHYTHWPTLFMGAAAFGIMYTLKKLAPRIPNVLVAVAVTTVVSWIIGFQRDSTISIHQIEVPALRESLLTFNSLIDDRDEKGEQRAKANEELLVIQKKGDPFELLDAEHKITKLNLLINEIKENIHDVRYEIRQYKMVQVEQKVMSRCLYEMGKVPKGNRHDSRIWRVIVNNDKLNFDEIKIRGGGAVVGVIPKGLPKLSIPKVDMGIVSHLLSYAAIISLLGFMEAISIAKAMAAKTGQRLDPNQELIGQGLANILGSFGKSYPTSGSFSRSAVNLQSGAISGFSSVVTSLMVIIVLLFFTPLLYHLPQSVLAAVIMMAVIGLINVTGFIHAWRAQWYDGVISVGTFICTLFFAPHLDRGIMVGVVLSLCIFLYKSMRPTIPSLARHEDESFRSAVAHGLRECRYLDMVRFDSPLFFANASYLEDAISERIRKKKTLKHIILVSNGINDIDASGEEVLSLLIDNVRSTGIEFSLSGVNEAVMEVLKRTYLIEKIGPENIYPTMEKAICAVHEKAHDGGMEEDCPLTTVCRVD